MRLFGWVHISPKQTSHTYPLHRRYTILKENSFHLKGKNYLQTRDTAMGTKMAVSFSNIFMAAVETEIREF